MPPFSYIPDLMNGLLITLILMFASLSVGLVLALLMTTAKMFAPALVRGGIDASIFFVRGTPLLVQIFLIYFGLGQFEWLRHSFLWFFFKEPMSCAIIALALNTACYTTVLFLGAIQSVPKNEIAACEALGMPKWLAFRRIIFPRAFKFALPAYSNEVLMILKGTSLASTITLLDLMGVTQLLISRTYAAGALYLVVGCIYLLLNGFITAIFKILISMNNEKLTNY